MSARRPNNLENIDFDVIGEPSISARGRLVAGRRAPIAKIESFYDDSVADGATLLPPDDHRTMTESTADRIQRSLHNERLAMIRQLEQSGDSFNDVTEASDTKRSNGSVAKLTSAFQPIVEQKSSAVALDRVTSGSAVIGSSGGSADRVVVQSPQCNQRKESVVTEAESPMSQESNDFDTKPLLPVAASASAAFRKSRISADKLNRTDNGVVDDANTISPVASDLTTSTGNRGANRPKEDSPVDEKTRARSIKLRQKLLDAVNEKKPTKIKKQLKSRGATSVMVTAKLKPLHVAVRHGSVDLIRPFVNVEPSLVQQADPDDGNTALLVAVAACQVSSVQWLVDHGGARLDVRNAQTGDGVWDVTRRLWLETNEAGKGVVVRTMAVTLVGLFNKYRNNYPTTPIHEASAAGDVAKVEFLIGIGFDLWADDQAGYNFVHVAAFNDKPEVIKHFIKQVYRDLNGKSNPPPLMSDAALSTGAERKNATNGKTPLHVAANRGSADSLVALMECGAQPTTIDLSGWTALHDAAAGRSEFSSAEIIRTLVHHSPDVAKSKNVDGETPLHVAARHGRLSAARVLAELVPDTLTAGDRDGWTPLHAAVYSRRPEVVSAVVNAAIVALGRDGTKRLTSTGDRTGRIPQHLVVQGDELAVELTKALETEQRPNGHPSSAVNGGARSSALATSSAMVNN